MKTPSYHYCRNVQGTTPANQYCESEIICLASHAADREEASNQIISIDKQPWDHGNQGVGPGLASKLRIPPPPTLKANLCTPLLNTKQPTMGFPVTRYVKYLSSRAKLLHWLSLREILVWTHLVAPVLTLSLVTWNTCLNLGPRYLKYLSELP